MPAAAVAGAAAKAAPRVSPKLAKQAAKIKFTPVGNKPAAKKPTAKKAAAPKKPPAAQRNSSFATKQYQARLGSKVAANKQIKQTNTRASGTAARQRVRTAGQITQQRVAANRQIRADNLEVREAERNLLERRRRGNALRGAVINQAKEPFRPHDTVSAPNFSRANIFMVILLMWAGIVLLYVLVTDPNETSSFLNRSREWVGLFYQTKPMFTTET